jgi:uncharacterized OB-fold protein
MTVKPGLDAYLRAGAQMMTDEYSQEGNDGVLRFQQCERCGYRRYPAAALCPECLAVEAIWKADSGEGTVWSFCVYHKAFHPAFAALLPYAVALVELDSGPRLITNIVDVPIADIHIGLRGRAMPKALPQGGSLVYFFASTQTGGLRP